MIFVTLGSQKFQFNRLLQKLDKLVESGTITEDVFAQIGYSDYNPQNYQYKEFLDRDEFSAKMRLCKLVITHGGTGAIIGAVKQGKPVIAVPRLAKYGEHVDDHQIQIVKQFKEMNIICSCYDSEQLEACIKEIENFHGTAYSSNTKNIIKSIEDYLYEIV